MPAPQRPLEGTAGRVQLVDLGRRILVGRWSGLLEITGVDYRALHFREGALHLDAAEQLPPRDDLGVGEVEGDPLWDPSSEERRLAAAAAAAIPLDGHRYRFSPGMEAASEDVGAPLPTWGWLASLAVADRPDEELEDELGGPDATLRAVDDPEALAVIPGLDETYRRVLGRLSSPTTYEQLARLEKGSGADLLRRVSTLVAVGAVSPVAGPQPLDEADDALTGPAVISRFLDRIGRSLDDRPLQIEAGEHRNRVAALLGRIGGLTHYEILDLEVDATPEDVTGAYQKLARLVHPRHAERLHLEERRGVLELLFEHATKAYLVLSDPERRKTYDREAAVRPRVEERSEEELEKVRREMARKNYDRAVSRASAEDFHEAVELLRSAVRWDPQARYYALLGEVASKNPKWLDDAVRYLEKALELAPREAGYRVVLGSLYEEMGDLERARREYETALEHMPSHPRAKTALEDLNARDGGHKGGWLRRLLGG